MRLVALGVVLAACGDNYSLQVSVQHPDGVDITSTTVTIYESPAAAIGCTEIEYHDISDEELAGLAVAEITVSNGTTKGALDGISRTGTKLVVARGFRMNGQLFTAGCTEQGTVNGDVTVVVKTQVVAQVSIGAVDADSVEIPLTITSPLGAPLPKRAIAWRAYGAVGAKPMTETNLTVGENQWEPTMATCAGPDGVTKLRPVPPLQIGGYAAKVRVSWGQEAPRLVSGFTKLERGSEAQLSNQNLISHPCAVRASGTTKRLVCVENVPPHAIDIAYSVTNGAAVPVTTTPPQMAFATAVGETIAAAYSVENGTARDVYAISNKGIVYGAFNPSRNAPAPGAQTQISNGEVTDVLVVPVCKAGDQAFLIARTTTDKLFVKADTAGSGAWVPVPLDPLIAPGAVGLNSAGCVTELVVNKPPVVQQTIAVDTTTGTYATYDCTTSTKCGTRLPIGGFGIGYARADMEQRLVASVFDATGTVLSEYVFLNERLVERKRFPSASFPQHVVTGKFDDDTDSDLFWDITNGLLARSSFQVAYAREIDGQPLTALSSANQGLVPKDVIVGDVTGDNFDDVILPTAAAVSVIPTHVNAKPVQTTTDDRCEP